MQRGWMQSGKSAGNLHRRAIESCRRVAILNTAGLRADTKTIFLQNPRVDKRQILTKSKRGKKKKQFMQN